MTSFRSVALRVPFAKWTSGRLASWPLKKFSQIDGAAVPAWIWVVALWAAMSIPAIVLRGSHLEEGTVVALARGAAEDGHWLAPYRYGIRFVERPVLLSWIAAVIGSLSGGVTVWAARIPHVLFLLAGGLMIFDLVKSKASQSAAVFGAMCWFAAPIVAQKFVTAEPDVAVSVLLFGAFFVWWKGVAARSVSLARWASIGLLLAAAGLTKGPQPLGYFTLGVGTYLLLRGRLTDWPGFLLANGMAGIVVGAWYAAVAVPDDVHLWLIHSRIGPTPPGVWLKDHANFVVSMFFEWLPSSLLFVVMCRVLRRTLIENELALAAALYAVVGTLALVVWPGGVATRYAMPGTLGIAVLSGILFDRYRASHPRIIGGSLVLAEVVVIYVIVVGWLVMPFAQSAFNRSSITAGLIKAQQNVPGPLYVCGSSIDLNVLAHFSGPVKEVSCDAPQGIVAPAIAALAPAEAAAVAAGRPDLRVVPRATAPKTTMSQIVEIQSR
jgi:4-amino-4-deoxy-L-arabinose transferase-like glycosyltransferase